MKSLIIEYQRVYHTVTQMLKDNDDVLAAFVFGSMVTGDLWENSDIDFFVICKGNGKGIENIYSNEEDIPVHFKAMDKTEFITLKGLEVKGSYLHRIFSSSKMVFSKDKDITARYDNERFYPETDRRKWTLSYLGRLVKSIDSTEKFLHFGHFYGAFNCLMESMELYASVYVNARGYLVSKDTISMVIGLDEEFKKNYIHLVTGGDLEEKTRKVNKYLKMTIDMEIVDASEVLLAYFREKTGHKSAREINDDEFFNNFNIHMEGILNLLFQKNILKRDFRIVESTNREQIIRENVYSL